VPVEKGEGLIKELLTLMVYAGRGARESLMKPKDGYIVYGRPLQKVSVASPIRFRTDKFVRVSVK